jgi:hypothetical protein
MPTTREILIYTFDELNDRAKEKAREWWRSCRDSNDFECVIEDAVRMLGILGFDVQTHAVQLMGGGTRQDPTIYWQVGYRQSDGAWIHARYAYAKGAHVKIRKEAPTDATLHDAADRLLALQRRYRYKLAADINNDDRQTRMEVSTPDVNAQPEDYREFKAIVRGLEQWIYTQLRTEDEYQSADAQVDENIRANEYEFDAQGNRI